MHLDKDVRDLLVSKFDIPRTGIREIVDGTVVSDGVCNEDLKSLTEEKMSEYLNGVKHETFGHLVDLVVLKLKEELNPTIKVEEKIDTEKLEIIEEAIKAASEPRPYCGACTTHRGRHSKNCVTNNTIK